MKVFKLEVLVLDFDGLGGEEIKRVLEDQKYPNYCIAPNILTVEEREIGEWSDNHPLNKLDLQKQEVERIFGKN